MNLKNTFCGLAAGLLLCGSSAAMAETNSSCVNYDGHHKIHGSFQGCHTGMIDVRLENGTLIMVPSAAIYWDTRPHLQATALTMGQDLTLFQPRPHMLTVMANQPVRSDGLMAVGSPDGVWFLPQATLTDWQNVHEDYSAAER